jgi:hypothetical protein
MSRGAVGFRIKHKVPHPYSRAGKSARSLTGIRDDDLYFFKAHFFKRTLDFRYCTNAVNGSIGNLANDA